MQSIDLYGDGIGKVELVDHMGTDLTIVNAARVSYGKHKTEFDDGDRKLIRYLMKNRHTSPTEHVSTTYRFVVPLFVRSQHHRHRTWCLAGDTKIAFNKPSDWKVGKHRPANSISLQTLYSQWHQGETSKESIMSRLVRVYDEQSRRFTVSSIRDVIDSGVKPIFKITLEGGYEVKATCDHRFLTTDGWKTLRDYGVEPIFRGIYFLDRSIYFLTNGSESPWREKSWMEDARNRGLSVQEIADEAGCSYHNIRKWLKIHDLKFDQIQVLQDHNKKHGVWNKGKSGYKTHRQPLTEAHLAAIRKARSGSACNFWKGGVTTERAKIGRWTSKQAAKVHKKTNYTCSHCGFNSGENYKGKLHVHHIKPIVDHPDLAYDVDNLTTLCVQCHYDWHTREGGEMRRNALNNKESKLRAVPRKVVSVEHVGEEQTYDLSIEGPHHNFLANKILCHNSMNEISRRYTSDDIQFYHPPCWRTQSKDNKQMSEENFDSPELDEMLRIHCAESYRKYEDMIEKGVAREMARMILPQNLYTQYYGTVNLHNALHFLGLRLHPHAQWEIQRVAQAMKEIMMRLYPETMKIWEELNA